MNHYKTSIKYIYDLKKIYQNALEAFIVSDSLKKLIAPNLVGIEEAEKNIECLINFNGFFTPVQKALDDFVLLELAKIFDNAKQSIHVLKLIKHSRSTEITIDDFKKNNKKRAHLEELEKNWEGITEEDIIKIESLLETNKIIIDQLKNYRDKVLAHNDKQKPTTRLSSEKIETLLKITENILNCFSSKMNSNTNLYEDIKKDCEKDTEDLIKLLRKSKF